MSKTSCKNGLQMLNTIFFFCLRWRGKPLKLNSHTVVRSRVRTQVMTYNLEILTFTNWAMTSRHVNTILICEKRKEKEKIYKYMQNVDKIKRLKFIKKKSAVLVHATFRINKKQNTLVIFYFFFDKSKTIFLISYFSLITNGISNTLPFFRGYQYNFTQDLHSPTSLLSTYPNHMSLVFSIFSTTPTFTNVVFRVNDHFGPWLCTSLS